MNHNYLNIKKANKIQDDTINKVLKIYFDNFEKNIQIPKRIILKRIKKKKYDIFLLKLGNKIIGFSFTVLFSKEKFIFIDYIAIDIDHQGRGYGKILFNHIYDYYIESKLANLLVLECENKLINMYQKWGCKRMPICYKFSDDTYLNIMTKSKGNLNITKYHAIKSNIHDLNRFYFSQKIIKNIFKISKFYDNMYVLTKCMKKIFIIIYSLLRYIFENSRIYYNFPEGNYLYQKN